MPKSYNSTKFAFLHFCPFLTGGFCLLVSSGGINPYTLVNPKGQPLRLGEVGQVLVEGLRLAQEVKVDLAVGTPESEAHHHWPFDCGLCISRLMV